MDDELRRPYQGRALVVSLYEGEGNATRILFSQWGADRQGLPQAAMI